MILTHTTINTIFIFGALLSIILPMIGLFFIIKKNTFILDICGHIYFGAYLLFKVLLSPLSYIASFVVSWLLAKTTKKDKIYESQMSVMIYYIFFTILMLAIVDLIKPEALDSIVFGNLLYANYINLIILLIEGGILFYISNRYKKIIFLDMLSRDFSKGVYGKETVNRRMFLFTFFSFLVLLHAITYFGVLLTVSIAILPYFTAKHVTRSMRNTLWFMVILSFISYIFSFIVSLTYDISLAVAYSTFSFILFAIFWGITFIKNKFIKK